MHAWGIRYVLVYFLIDEFYVFNFQRCRSKLFEIFIDSSKGLNSKSHDIFKGQEISEENSLTGWSTPATTQSSPNGSPNNSPRGVCRVLGRPLRWRGCDDTPLGSPKQQNESKPNTGENETVAINRVTIKRVLKNCQLVVLAIKNSPDGLVTTNELYNFCVENFSECSTFQPEPNFKNSMRHTLWKKVSFFSESIGEILHFQAHKPKTFLKLLFPILKPHQLELFL